MNRNKCNRCGLINSASDENCRRCKINLCSAENAPPRYAPEPPVADIDSPKKKGSIVTSFAICMLISSILYYFHTRDDDKVRMRLIIENDRQRQQEMLADRQKESDRKNLEKYNNQGFGSR
jgi:hypothetical protein